MEIRDAVAEDAPAACEVLRRSISELCVAEVARAGGRVRVNGQPHMKTTPRHYGLFANANRAENIATARALLHIVPPADPQKQPNITLDALRVLPCPCPRCGARMIVIEVFPRGCQPRWRPMASRVDTS